MGKQFKKIRDWEEWEKHWEENDVADIAVGLLHAAPKIIAARVDEGFGIEDPGNKAIRFFLQTTLNFPDKDEEQRVVREKAHDILIFMLGRYWDELLLGEELVSDIVNFFADHDQSRLGQALRKTKETTIMRIWELLKHERLDGYRTWLNKKEFRIDKTQLAKALVKAELFHFIVEQEIFEAIPAMEESLLPAIKKILETKRDRRKELIPAFSDETIVEALKNPLSMPMGFALKDARTQHCAGALILLLSRRVVATAK
jgi:hypothetical protein